LDSSFAVIPECFYRESILNLAFIKEPMDSRFRGNDNLSSDEKETIPDEPE
jgi:hypothetical protein